MESNPRLGTMPDVRILLNDFPCLLLITIMLIVVADEVNSLSKLRQYFPRESEFCFEFPSPHHCKPCSHPSLGLPTDSHLVHSCCIQVETPAGIVQGLLLLLVNSNVYVIGYSNPSTGKSTTVVFFYSSFYKWLFISGTQISSIQVVLNSEHGQVHFIIFESTAPGEKIETEASTSDSIYPHAHSCCQESILLDCSFNHAK